MKVGIPRETAPGERRAAASPASVRRLIQLGFEVEVDRGLGVASGLEDDAYQEAGAQIVEDPDALWSSADLVLKVRAPTEEEVLRLKPGATIVSFLWPAQNPGLVEALRVRRVTAIAMDQVPRITRAQSMDALSSMANIAGYRAVIEAATSFGRFFTGQVTAAGKMPPAKVLVIGAGVAGLAALGTAKAMGAIVRAFDTRPSVKEQVESMGAEFLELDFEEEGEGAGGYAKTMSPEFIAAEMELFRQQLTEVDIVVTTALIPGKQAPTLLTRDMVEGMKAGSVIVDLAAEQGGNCEVTLPGQKREHHGVTVIGYTDLPSRMAGQATALYANNVTHLLTELGGAETFDIDLENEITRGATVTHEGEVLWPPPRRDPTPRAPGSTRPGPRSVRPRSTAPKGTTPPPGKSRTPWGAAALLLLGIAALSLGAVAPSDFLGHLTVFVLSVFIGWQVIWNVTAALHTPLMSVTNAISGIIIVGGMLHQQAGAYTEPATILGAVAILVASVNIAGGFLVTHRMLRMFHK